MSNFPPRTTREREVEAALGVLAGVVEGRGAVYVSAPITSGKRFSAWLAGRNGDYRSERADHSGEFQREVVERNREHAREIVRSLRRSCEGVLIDPTAVADLPGWTQDDYRDFWGRLIERYAREVVFIDGWHHSNGCCYEFLVACRRGVAASDERRRPLSTPEGLALVESAVSEMRAQSMPTDFLERVAAELRALVAGEAGRA